MATKFILFAGESYDRGEGGWRDFVEFYDSVEEAVKKAEHNYSLDDNWAHVVNAETRDIVKSGYYDRDVPNDKKTAKWKWKDGCG